ncbi:MAG: translation elongation factor Ts [Fimbriimonadales bacterium]
MAISAQLVKRLREETDAPMMECKRSLEAAENEGVSGDEALIARAKEILKETGKLAAVKRQDRAVSVGTVAIGKSGNAAAAVSLLCETDFVARNEDFIALAQTLADAFAANDPGSDPLNSTVGGKKVQDLLDEAVAKIRENIQLGTVVRMTSDGTVGGYLHHDKAKAALVAISGSEEDIAKKLGTQIVALSPEFISKEGVDQERLSKMIEAERQKAIEAGKPAEIAQKIAEGKVGKELLSEIVLLEQQWYADLSKKVGDVISGTVVFEFARVEAGKQPIHAKA